MNKYNDIQHYDTLIELFNDCCSQYGGETAYENFSNEISYAELLNQAQNFSKHLHHELKLNKQERIAIMLPNSIQHPICMFGALMAGLIVVNINPLYTTRELHHQLKDSGATTIVVLENMASTVLKALPNTNIKHIIISRLGDCLSSGKGMIINFMVKYIKRMVPSYRLPQAILLKNLLKPSSLPAMRDFNRVQ